MSRHTRGVKLILAMVSIWLAVACGGGGGGIAIPAAPGGTLHSGWRWIRYHLVE